MVQHNDFRNLKMAIDVSLYVRWWKTWRTLPVRSWVRAASLYRSGRFAEAQRFYQKGVETHPHHPARFSARLDLAFCLTKTGQYPEAEEQLRHVITFCPDFREAHVRLAQLQLWVGHSLEAAWTLRRALQRIPPDMELAALFLVAVLDNGGPSYLLQEAIKVARKANRPNGNHPLLNAALARLEVLSGDAEQGTVALTKVALEKDAPIESLLLLAETHISSDKVALARQHLKRALAARPNHPYALSLSARCYLHDGPFYNPEFAVQLATSACQNTGWQSPREMHVLAEAFYRSGDKIAALMMASRAKHEGSRLLGTYRDVKTLDKLIQSLSSGTLV